MGFLLEVGERCPGSHGHLSGQAREILVLHNGTM